MRVELSSGPAVEPVSVAQAKRQLWVEHNTDNTYIEGLVTAARQLVEARTRRQLITATWKLYLDGWPSRGPTTATKDEGAIYLPKPPVQSVSNIKYYDTSGTEQTLSTSYYTTDFVSNPPRIVEAYGYTWPSLYDRINAVTVTYVAGYGDAATDVPAALRHAIKLLVYDWYENRGSVMVGTITRRIEHAFTSLIAAYKIYGPAQEYG